MAAHDSCHSSSYRLCLMHELVGRAGFEFDLNGYLIRPAILDRETVDAIRQQLHLIKHDPASLPPAERSVPGGASQVLIDHPRVVDVIHEVIGPDIRIESAGSVVREKGQRHAGLHGGHLNRGAANDANSIDPIFGYRVSNGRIHAGMVRVIFELTDIHEETDGATVFIPVRRRRHYLHLI